MNGLLIGILKLLGFNRYCPICRTPCKKFHQYGANPRKEAQCPKCGSLERHRLMYLYLKNETELFSRKMKLIHFSPENCLRKVFEKQNNIEYVTADLERADVDFKADMTKLPFKDNTYDAIICIHVLEHIVDDETALKELLRILKPGGWALIQVPMKTGKTFEDLSITDPEARLKNFGQSDHVRLYGEDFGEILISSGFRTKRLAYAQKFGDREIDYYRLLPDDKKTEYFYQCFK